MYIFSLCTFLVLTTVFEKYIFNFSVSVPNLTKFSIPKQLPVEGVRLVL